MRLGGGGVHCAMLGLDASGKTTILYRIKFGHYVNSAPTIGFNCEKVGPCLFDLGLALTFERPSQTVGSS